MLASKSPRSTQCSQSNMWAGSSSWCSQYRSMVGLQAKLGGDNDRITHRSVAQHFGDQERQLEALLVFSRGSHAVS